MRRFLVTFFIVMSFVCFENALAQWVATGGPTGLTNALASQGSNILAGTGTGVFVSTDNGANWTLGTGITGASTNVLSVCVSGTNIFAGTYGGGIFLSTNNGSTWTAVNTGLTGNALYVYSFAVTGSSIYAGTSSGVYLSTDNGATWTAKNTGISGVTVVSLLITATEFFAGTNGAGVYLSTNGGTTWTAKNTGLTNTSVWSLVLSGSNLFAGTIGGGVFLSTNSGSSWTAMNTGLTVLSSTPNIEALAISGTYILAGFRGNGVFLSIDNGSNWTPWNTGLAINGAFFPLLISGTNVFVANAYGGVWRRPLLDLVAPTPPLGMVVTDSSSKTITIKWRKNTEADFLRYRVYLATSSNPTSKVDSTTGGISDTSKTLTGLTNGTRYYARVTAVDSAGNESGYSNEVNAVPADRLAPAAPQNLIVLDSTSTKVGIRWRKNADADFLRYRIYRGTSPAPTTKVDSTTGGIADTSRTFTGLTNGTRYYLRVTAVDSSGNESAYSNQVNAAPNAALAVDDLLSQIPTEYSLLQNFPNPFNPSTTIAFDLPSSAHVRLRIFDLLGREVASLVNEELSAGKHQAQWNASKMSSGVYFYRIEAGQFVAVRKLVLLK